MCIIGWMVYHVSKRASRLVLMNYLLSECQPSHNHRQAVNSRGKNLSRDTPIADLSISLTLSTEIQSSSESHPESDDRNFQFCDGVLFMWEKSWTFTDSSVYEKGFTQMCRLNSTDIDLLLANGWDTQRTLSLCNPQWSHSLTFQREIVNSSTNEFSTGECQHK